MGKRKKPHVCQIRMSTALYEATQKFRDNREFSSLVTRLLSNYLEDQDAEKEELRQEIEERQARIREEKSELASLEQQLEGIMEAEQREEYRRQREEEAREQLQEHYEESLKGDPNLLEWTYFEPVAEAKGFLDELGEERVREIVADVTEGEVTP